MSKQPGSVRALLYWSSLIALAFSRGFSSSTIEDDDFGIGYGGIGIASGAAASSIVATGKSSNDSQIQAVTSQVLSTGDGQFPAATSQVLSIAVTSHPTAGVVTFLTSSILPS